MRLTKEQEELLDKYAMGLLSSEEMFLIEKMRNSDEEFKALADQHLLLIKSIKESEEREQVQRIMDIAHNEMGTFTKEPVPLGNRETVLKNYWALSAIAASIAVVSIVGTLFITRSIQKEQSANYYELRRNVEQIKKSQKQIMADIAGEKIRKSPGNFAGTGFLISSAGYLTTSYHVIKEADSVYVENEKFGLRKAIVAFSDQLNDIAILKIEPDGVRGPLPYVLAKKEIGLAEDVYTLGYPREEIVFGSGSISALSGYKDNPNAYQISVPVNPGNSGGPLFNSGGDLVGIISGTQAATSGVAFATKSTVLYQLIAEKAPDSVKSVLVDKRKASARSSSRVSQVSQWKDYVFIVRVYKN